MTAGSWTLRMSPVSSVDPATTWPPTTATLERRVKSARRQCRTETCEPACLDFKSLDFMFICSVNEQTQQTKRNLKSATVRGADLIAGSDFRYWSAAGRVSFLPDSFNQF